MPPQARTAIFLYTAPERRAIARNGFLSDLLQQATRYRVIYGGLGEKVIKNLSISSWGKDL